MTIMYVLINAAVPVMFTNDRSIVEEKVGNNEWSNDAGFMYISTETQGSSESANVREAQEIETSLDADHPSEVWVAMGDESEVLGLFTGLNHLRLNLDDELCENKVRSIHRIVHSSVYED